MADAAAQEAYLLANGWTHQRTFLQLSLQQVAPLPAELKGPIAIGTPRADAELLSRGAHSHSLGVIYVPVDFARQLERELNLARRERDEMHAQTSAGCGKPGYNELHKSTGAN
jgi:hypothetical protein